MAAERPQRAADVAGRVARGEAEPYTPREVKPEDLAAFGFDKLVGLKDQIDLIRQQIVLPLQYPSAFQVIPSKTLVPHLFLYGPPATGKTDLAMSIAKETGASLFLGAGSTLQSSYQAQSARNFSALVSAAAYRADTGGRWAIVFLDEGDVLLASKTESGDRNADTNVTEAFKDLVQFGSTVRKPLRVLIIVATNLPGRIEDEAVLSRFGLKLFVGPPRQIRMLTPQPVYPRLSLLLRGVNAINQTPRCGETRQQLLSLEALAAYVRAEDAKNRVPSDPMSDEDILHDLELALYFYNPRELDVLVNLTANLMEPTPFHLDEYRYGPSDLDRKCLDVYKRAAVDPQQAMEGADTSDLWVLAYPPAATVEGTRVKVVMTRTLRPGKSLQTLADIVQARKIGTVRWGIITADTVFRMLSESSVYPIYTRELLDRYLQYAQRLRDSASVGWIADILRVGEERFRTRFFRNKPGLRERAPFWQRPELLPLSPEGSSSGVEEEPASKKRKQVAFSVRPSSIDALVEGMLGSMRE
jgi:DNA polymerase III delta prime subunit